MEVADIAIAPLKEFMKDSVRLVKKCTKPDRREFTLIASKTATLPLLLTIAPEGTVDPSPLLYDDAFYTLAGFSALACVCNLAAYRLPRPLRL